MNRKNRGKYKKRQYDWMHFCVHCCTYWIILFLLWHASATSILGKRIKLTLLRIYYIVRQPVKKRFYLLLFLNFTIYYIDTKRIQFHILSSGNIIFHRNLSKFEKEWKYKYRCTRYGIGKVYSIMAEHLNKICFNFIFMRS